MAYHLDTKLTNLKLSHTNESMAIPGEIVAQVFRTDFCNCTERKNDNKLSLEGRVRCTCPKGRVY